MRRFQQNPVVSCGDEEDGAVLYNPDTDKTSVINLTGLELWTLLQSPRTQEEMIDHMLRNYSGVSVEKAEEDIQLFIEALCPDFLLETPNEN